MTNMIDMTALEPEKEMTPNPKVPWSEASRKLLNFGEPYPEPHKSSEQQSEQEEKDPNEAT